MVEMGWHFDDPYLEAMNSARWLTLYVSIQERERDRLNAQLESFKILFQRLLGLELNEETVIPLSAFINPDMFDHLSKTQTEGVTDSAFMDEDEVIYVIEEMNRQENKDNGRK